MTTEPVKVTFSAKNPEQDPIKEVDLRARQFMSRDTQLSYRDAVHRVFRDPSAPDAEELHLRYLNETPPLRANTRRA
jgi:hypothetical protein